MWNYAELTKTAKMSGGPEKYIADLVNDSFAAGKMQAIIHILPWAALAFPTCGLIGYGIGWMICKQREKKRARLEEDARLLANDIDLHNEILPN